MTKDDLFKVLYLILKYIYGKRKHGEIVVSIEEVTYQLSLDSLNAEYLDSIIRDAMEAGYIKGYDVDKRAIKFNNRHTVNCISITMAGVEYLDDNSMMKKAKDLLDDAATIKNLWK